MVRFQSKESYTTGIKGRGRKMQELEMGDGRTEMGSTGTMSSSRLLQLMWTVTALSNRNLHTQRVMPK